MHDRPTYPSTIKLLFSVSVRASADAPDSPMLLLPRLRLYCHPCDNKEKERKLDGLVTEKWKVWLFQKLKVNVVLIVTVGILTKITH